MDETTQYVYQVPDLKVIFLMDFGNVIRQIVDLLTYSDISADTKTFDREELRNKLRAAISYALALLASTWGYSMSEQDQEGVKMAKAKLTALFNRVVSNSQLTYLELLDIYFTLIQQISIILNYKTPVPRPRPGNYEIT